MVLQDPEALGQPQPVGLQLLEASLARPVACDYYKITPGFQLITVLAQD